jgi:hypothetical protein
MSSFEEVEEVYDAAEAASSEGWQVFQVAWPAFRLYHQTLRRLEACIQEHDLIEEWAVFLTFNKRFQFFLSTTPLAPSVILNTILSWKKTPSQSLTSLKFNSPVAVTKLVDELITSFAKLQEEVDSPLWRVAMAECFVRHEDGASIAVLYSDNRLGGPLEFLLSSHGFDNLNFYAVRATELKKLWIYDQLIVFGPTRRRFDDGSGFVFKSPRANLLTLFVTDFYSADIPSPYDLVGSPHCVGGSNSEFENQVFGPPIVWHCNPYEQNLNYQETAANAQITHETATNDEWLSVLPSPNVKYRPFNDRELQIGEMMETIAAKQVFLSSDYVAYLPEDGSVYRLVDDIDPDSGIRFCQGVEHIGVDEVGVGEILLFSEEGGGKMIFDVANQILGDDMERLRGVQKFWKDIYFRKTRDSCDTVIIRELKILGAKSVTSGMIHNWRSPLNIGPGSWSNFDLLLKYCELDSRRDEIFQATRSIRRAHIQAGAQLAGRLLEMMRGQSLDELHASGKQVFGGTPRVPTQKVAFFVQCVATGTVNVLPNDVAKPVVIEEGSWL